MRGESSTLRRRLLSFYRHLAHSPAPIPVSYSALTSRRQDELLNSLLLLQCSSLSRPSSLRTSPLLSLLRLLRWTSDVPPALQPCTNTLSHRLKKADLLGTPYIPTSFRPSVFLQLDFPSGASVQLGNHVLPSQGVEEPTISFLSADPTSTGESYALVSFDPDAPSRENQEFGPWRHWIVGGLKPISVDSITQSSEKPLVEKSEEALTPWTGPSPGKATG